MKNNFFQKAVAIAAIVCILMTTSIINLPAQAAGSNNLPTLTVDMGTSTGRSLYHGASGWLYGLGDDGLPSTNTITPLKAHTTVQKAPLGMQHPDGDVLDIANTFLNSGGQQIQIYMPDYFALWFYEVSDPYYYLEVCKMQAQACIDAGIYDDVYYVPYNEPNAGWVDSYVDENGNTVTGWTSLFWLWNDILDAIKEVYVENGITAEPKFVGLNLAVYDQNVMTDFMTFCAAHDCVPDIISWHDLATWQYNIFGSEYNHYRSLESSLGLAAREIVINEYAAQGECASPGDLIRWIGLFEDYEVAGCLPFWHLSNNLNGLAAGTNEGTGAWWLYKWYGDMSGEYKNVSVFNASQDDYYGVATLDDNKKSATVLFGGVKGQSNIVLDDIDETQTYNGAEIVHIKVEGTDFTGFHGAADEPYVVKEGAVQVIDGAITIPMSNMADTSAYKITVTQASDNETTGLLSSTYRTMYEAESGTLTGGAAITSFDSRFAGSGGQRVDNLSTSSDSISLSVCVPHSGYYKYDMLYSAAVDYNKDNLTNHYPVNSILNLTVNGDNPINMNLDNTAGWDFSSIWSRHIYLNAGTNTIKIAGTTYARRGSVDCIYLTYMGTEESNIKFSSTYEAEAGEFNELAGNTTSLSTESDGTVNYITGLETSSVTSGGGVRFTVVVPDDGMYLTTLNYSSQNEATANIYVDNDAVNLSNLRTSVALNNTEGDWQNGYATIYLQQGINIIDIETTGKIYLNSMRVDAADNSEPITIVEAEDGILTGEAAIGGDRGVQSFASGGSYVSAIKAANNVKLLDISDPENKYGLYGLGAVDDLGESVDKNSLTITVNVPENGEYKMVVHQSYDELFGNHSYNWQMVQRYAVFEVNGGNPQKVAFLNSYSNESFDTHVINVSLKAGDNTIKIYNDNSKVVTNGLLPSGANSVPEEINYNALTNYTPNFDKFEFYAITAESLISEIIYYSIATSTTSGGTVTTNKSSAAAGENVKLTFTANEGAVLTKALVNGEDITDKLADIGGVYTVYDIQEDIDVKAYFEESDNETITMDSPYLYAVNAGDINPGTLSSGDFWGIRQSVTDQFFAEDPVTGFEWGILDTYVYDGNYPNYLTGAKTWPAENIGATDSSSKSETYRYARNQATSDVGIIYKFELEPNKTYNVELGFYVASSWTSEWNPRTMKLLFNDTVINDNFTASNDSSNPYMIKSQAAADANGYLTIQIGHADNAAWGPVVSYIEIMGATDKTELDSAINEYSKLTASDYYADGWTAFETALADAMAVSNDNNATQADVNQALYNLKLAVSNLKESVDKTALQELVDKYQDEAQGMTSDDNWKEFLHAMNNAAFILENQLATSTHVESALSALNNAITKLAILQSIEVTKLPDTVDYYVGDAFDPTGMEVTVYYSSGLTGPVESKVLADTEYTLSGYDFSSPGTVNITVTYNEFSDTFAVTVTDKPQEIALSSILVTPPAKTEYKTGEKLDLTGLTVTARYTDGSNKTLSANDYTIDDSNFDSENAGTYTIAINYSENGIVKTDIFEVIVTESSPPEPTDPTDPTVPTDPIDPTVPTDSTHSSKQPSANSTNSGNNNNVNNGTKATKTGDESSILLWVILCMAAISILITALYLKLKKNKTQ